MIMVALGDVAGIAGWVLGIGIDGGIGLEGKLQKGELIDVHKIMCMVHSFLGMGECELRCQRGKEIERTYTIDGIFNKKAGLCDPAFQYKNWFW